MHAAVAPLYCEQVSRALGMSATWRADLRLQAGHVYRYNGSALSYAGSPGEYGLPEGFSTTAGAARENIVKGVTLASDAEASAGAVAASGLARVKLAAGTGLMYCAESLTIDRHDRSEQLRKELLNQVKSGEWDTELIVVEEVVHAARLTVVVSEGNEAEVDLELAADGAALGLPGIEAGKAGFSLAASTDLAWTFETTDATPLFHALAVRRRLALGPKRVVHTGEKQRLRPGDDIEVAHFDWLNAGLPEDT